MKTIYLFGVCTGAGKIVKRRISEIPESKGNETHIATLNGQPDNYWQLAQEMIGVRFDSETELDYPTVTQ